MNDKIYIDGMIIKERTITGKNGDFNVMNISVNLDEFMESLEKIYTTDKNGKRWANLTMKKRSEPSQSGVTHYVVPNDWTPNNSDVSLDEIPF